MNHMVRIASMIKLHATTVPTSSYTYHHTQCLIITQAHPHKHTHTTPTQSKWTKGWSTNFEKKVKTKRSTGVVLCGKYQPSQPLRWYPSLVCATRGTEDMQVSTKSSLDFEATAQPIWKREDGQVTETAVMDRYVPYSFRLFCCLMLWCSCHVLTVSKVWKWTVCLPSG